MFDDEKRIALTHDQIRKDLLGDSLYQLSAGFSAFIISLIILCFSIGAFINEISKLTNNFESTLVWYYNFVVWIIGELALAAVLVISTVLLVPHVKRVYISFCNSFELVCDELDYITTEDEVRYSFFHRYLRRRFVTVDKLHFKTYGIYNLKTHPTKFAGGEKFYLVVSKNKEKIYKVYSQKTYFYK